MQGDKKDASASAAADDGRIPPCVDEAYAGDIIGVFDPGIFSIGDTICAPGKKVCIRRYSYICTGTFCESPSD